MDQVEIPCYFLCPISLQLMKDPVTLSTGITYDRDSIEQWIYAGKQPPTCPVSRQPLLPADGEPTPNHTLRRLIQAWCVVNSPAGFERLPTPTPPVDRARVAQLLDAAQFPCHSQLRPLRELKAIVAESERNKRCVAATPGVFDILASLVAGYRSTSTAAEEVEDDDCCSVSTASACDEALGILHALQISEDDLHQVVAKNAGLIKSLTEVMRRSSYQSRAHATLLLKSIVAVLSPAQVGSLGEELFQETVNAVRDRISPQATKAALQVLAEASRPSGRNRIKAVNAGAVHALVELLLDGPERRACELALVVLDRLCGCAEGRAELVGHAAGVPVVAKKILRVSQAASERAVRVLHAVAKHSARAALLQEMLQAGVVAKLCLVLQVECGGKTKEKAREMLRLHSMFWRRSPCLSPQFQLSYP